MPVKSNAVLGVNKSRTAGIANDARISRRVISTFPVRDCSQVKSALDVSCPVALSLKADTHQYPATNSNAAMARHAHRPAFDFAMRSA